MLCMLQLLFVALDSHGNRQIEEARSAKLGAAVVEDCHHHAW